jgi:uncharacterized membrane protein HdeD (DUF308 family)
MISVLEQNWWAFAVRGIIAILFGLAAFALPGTTILSLVFLFAGYAGTGGVLAIIGAIHYARTDESWGLLALEGLVSLLAAIVAVATPGLTVTLFLVLLASWAVLSGVLMLMAALNVDTAHGGWWLVLGGMAATLYGATLIAAPTAAMLVLIWALGAYSVAFGIALIFFAFRLRVLLRSTGI